MALWNKNDRASTDELEHLFRGLILEFALAEGTGTAPGTDLDLQAAAADLARLKTGLSQATLDECAERAWNQMSVIQHEVRQRGGDPAAVHNQVWEWISSVE